MLTGMCFYWSLPAPTLSYWCTSTKEWGTPNWLATFIRCEFFMLMAVKTVVYSKIFADPWVCKNLRTFHTTVENL